VPFLDTPLGKFVPPGEGNVRNAYLVGIVGEDLKTSLSAVDDSQPVSLDESVNEGEKIS
jgi:hypothetical protein